MPHPREYVSPCWARDSHITSPRAPPQRGCISTPGDFLLTFLSPTDGLSQGRFPLAPPYAVVLISCSGLLAFVFLLLTCLCCKRGDVGFKEFENPDGEEYSGEYTPPAEETSSSQSIPDVYILPLSEVSLPATNQQMPKTDLVKHMGLSRQHLSYLQEIGNGWFGKVILGEIFSDFTPAQVVVKELRASAGPLEQRKSLGVTIWELFEFGSQPYRHLSDEEVLAFVIKEQQMKLAKPRLKLPYSDYCAERLLLVTFQYEPYQKSREESMLSQEDEVPDTRGGVAMQGANQAQRLKSAG
nr:serine/threonine-protein kinase LMTK3-like [Pelodiscus sinensis]|eukprot:XP_025039725.1 serine/threonine-protein kinase LMTK3-like [Pelodiscus sinensis]